LAQTVTAPRARKSFSRLKHVLDLPNLIDIQRESFDWFLREGLRETIDDISPIEDYTGSSPSSSASTGSASLSSPSRNAVKRT